MHLACSMIYWSNSILDKKLYLTVICTYKLFLATNTLSGYEQALGKTSNIIGSLVWVTLFSDC